MASSLGDGRLLVFDEYMTAQKTETETQQTALFNEATRGAITMASGSFDGDVNHMPFYKKLADVVGYVDPTSDDMQTEVHLEQDEEIEVKMQMSTKPVRIDPSSYAWINTSPQDAGMKFGEQQAAATMAIKLNSIIASLSTAIGGRITVASKIPTGKNGRAAGDTRASSEYGRYLNKIGTKKDKSGGTRPSIDAILEATALMGDAANRVVAWVMDARTYFNYLRENVANKTFLFNYGSINVSADPRGIPIIYTDSPQLRPKVTLENAQVEVSTVLGLVEGAGNVKNTMPYRQITEEKTGANIIRVTYQGEEQVAYGCKGFKWRESAGRPTSIADLAKNDVAVQGNAAVTDNNWVSVMTDDVKDAAGIRIDFAY